MFLNIFLWCSKGEIDAHEDSFRATAEAGQALLNTGHYASDEVKEKVGQHLGWTISIFIRKYPMTRLTF